MNKNIERALENLQEILDKYWLELIYTIKQKDYEKFL